MEDSDFFVKLSSFSEHISNFLYKFFQIGFVKIHSFQKSNFAACQLACHSHWERSKLESALSAIRRSAVTGMPRLASIRRT